MQRLYKSYKQTVNKSIAFVNCLSLLMISPTFLSANNFRGNKRDTNLKATLTQVYFQKDRNKLSFLQKIGFSPSIVRLSATISSSLKEQGQGYYGKFQQQIPSTAYYTAISNSS